VEGGVKPQPDEAREWAKRLRERFLIPGDEHEALASLLESQAERIETLEGLARETHGALAMIEESTEQARLLGLAQQAAAAIRHHACVLSEPGRYQADQTSIMIACEAAITPYATRLAALTAAGVKTEETHEPE
jgi:hypothetical protein